jgi:hypothetical protein
LKAEPGFLLLLLLLLSSYFSEILFSPSKNAVIAECMDMIT